MTKGQSIQWKRVSLEVFTIVASILLAFSIDAWWDDRQQHNEEQIILQRLLKDLQDMRNYLAEQIRYNEAIFESAQSLQRISAGVEEGVSETSIDRLIGDIWWYNVDTTWELVSLTQLFAGGGLSFLENTNLAQKLLELQLSIFYLRAFYKAEENFHHNQMLPFLNANANMAQIVSKIEHEPGNPQNRYAFGDVGIDNVRLHSELLSNTEFQNLLIAKMGYLNDIIFYGYQGLDDQFQEIISIIETELDE